MAYARGSRSALVFKPESSYGVAPSGNYTGITFKSETLDENIGKFSSGEIRTDRTQAAIRSGNIANGGSIMTDFGISRFGLFLEHLLACTSVVGSGTVAGTVVNTQPSGVPLAAGAYVRGQYATNNTQWWVCVTPGTVTSGEASTGLTGVNAGDNFTTATSKTVFQLLGASGTPMQQYVYYPGAAFPTGGLSIEKGIIGAASAEYIQFQGMRLESLSMSIPQEGIVSADWALLGTSTLDNAATSGGGTPTYTADDPVTGYDTFLSIASATGNRPFKTVKLDIKNNFDPNVFILNQRTRADITEGIRQATGNIDMFFQDETEYLQFKNETVVDMKLSMIRRGCYWEIDLPECKFTGQGTPKISGPGIINQAFNFDAYHEFGSYDMRVTFTNLEAAGLR